MKRVTQEQVGARLAEHRKRAGYTQIQAAEKLGISSDTLSRLERGTQWTDFKMFSEIARLYHVDWADLLAVFSDGKEAKHRATIQEVVDLLRPRNLSEIELARDLLSVLFKADRKK